MKKRAVVLGAGGTVGVAWELGVAAGLLDQGVDLAQADLFVGTSAGSVVGAVLAAGVNVHQLLMMRIAMGASAAPSLDPVDPEGAAAIMARWNSFPEMDQQARKELGALSMSARTMDEATWLNSFRQLLGDHGQWPERPLQITAVDAQSGEFMVFDRHAGAPLHAAVAASCTVPGLFPPVSIGGRRYIDGGVHSTSNAHLAQGYGSVVILAPLAAGRSGAQLEREAAHLKAAGSTVEIVVPDAEALQALRGDTMDASQVGPAAMAGLRQGREAAQRLAALWSEAG